MTQWSFVLSRDGLWYWRRERVVGEERVTDCGRLFERRDDCMRDAIVNGLRAQDGWRVPGREGAHIGIASEDTLSE